MMCQYVEDAAKSLKAMLDKSLSYVSRVVAGETQGDPKVGRFLLDTVSAVPKVQACNYLILPFIFTLSSPIMKGFCVR